jgi:hypothetical protein
LRDGWQRKFDDPIEAPDGTRLNTLKKAVAYLAKTIPKSERSMPAVTLPFIERNVLLVLLGH